jgi:hypothetical protein
MKKPRSTRRGRHVRRRRKEAERGDAREGARKALATYDLHEKAIRKAEAAAKK